MADLQPQTPRQQEEEEHLLTQLKENERLGTPLNIPSMPFRVSADDIARAVVTGPRRYMVRLRRIELGTEYLLAEARLAWIELALRHADDPARFARQWQTWAATVDVAELNKLIDAHNRWYPVEANLPMNPRTSGYVTFDGRDYRREPIDAAWLLARFPADLAQALTAGETEPTATTSRSL